MALWYEHTGPEHLRSDLADQTVKWVPGDSEEWYRKNRADPKQSALLDAAGWTDESIEYRYNHQGFRSCQFDDRPCAIAIGCSLTEGVGLRLDQTWPHILGAKLGIQIWNLGVGGAGTATNLRILQHYLPLLRPRFVVHCVPSQFRFEYRNEWNMFTNVLPATIDSCGSEAHHFFRVWFGQDDNSHNYHHAHVMAIKWICHEQAVPYHALSMDALPFDRIARDLLHPGVKSQVRFAERMYDIMKPQGE